MAAAGRPVDLRFPPPDCSPERDVQRRATSFADKVFVVLFFASVYLLTRRWRDKNAPQLGPGITLAPAEIAALISLLAVVLYASAVCCGVKKRHSDGFDEGFGTRPHLD